MGCWHFSFVDAYIKDCAFSGIVKSLPDLVSHRYFSLCHFRSPRHFGCVPFLQITVKNCDQAYQISLNISLFCIFVYHLIKERQKGAICKFTLFFHLPFPMFSALSVSKLGFQKRWKYDKALEELYLSF